MALSEVALATPPPAPPDKPPAPTSKFDLDDLKIRGFAKLVQYVLDEPHWLFWLLRQIWPIPTFKNWALVTRYDDVQEVLEHDDVFHVPFGDKVERLDGGPNFLLGMQRSDDYWRIQRQVMQAFRRDDVATIVAPLAARFSQDIVAEASGRLDAVEGLITRVPMLICEAYYGVPIPNKVDFGHWTIAMSTYMFGDPTDNPRFARAALAAGDRVRPVVDEAIAAAKQAERPPDNVLGRLITMQQTGATGLSDEVIRSYLIGMITGFVPTNTMAAGHMLEMLLQRHDFMERTRAAALAGDDGLLTRCLFEAMRFKPLNPGPFRVCNKDYRIADGTRRAKTIKAGTKLLAGTESAMFDGRRVKRPRSFDPDRPPTDYMLFGHGLHWCLGAFIASAQITETFKVLLRQKGLRPAKGTTGELELIGPFPAHLWVEFDT